MNAMEEENSSSSDSSIDEDGIEKELISKAKNLEDQLFNNKYFYDAHIEVITIYRKLSDLNSLREAYQRFHECFPLTPKLWLEWIKDEIKIANTSEEQLSILKLFEKAVDDYLSVELWMEYAQYSISVTDLQTTRAILEKGLISAGLHASEGHLLWDTLRELEHAHISLHQENSEEWTTQIKRLADIFKRQLSVPLLNMENTYLEWTEWFKTLPDGLVDSKPVEWGYKKALQTLEAYKPLEDKLLSAEERDMYDIYKEYIKMVKDPSTVLCLYERALVTLCLTPSLWQEYIKFSFKMKEVVLKITSRALRNCAWSEQLWIARLRTLEHYQQDEKYIVTCFEQGLSSINPSPPLEFWFSFLEYYHRNCEDNLKLDKLFSKAFELITSQHDPTYKLKRWYARLVAKRGNIEEARKIWADITSDPNIHGVYKVNLWLEFANLEKMHGEPNQVRKIFKRAASSCKTWAQPICDEWLLYEREIGSLEDVMKCTKACEEFLKNIPRYSQSTTHSVPTHSEKPVARQKRKYDDGEDLNFKKIKLSQDSKRQKEPKPSAPKVIEKDPKTTVFVSNLHPSVTEEHLKSIFPNALHTSIVFDKKGKSRCFGYVQFSKEEEAMTALARDRVPIDGRPVFISELKASKDERKLEFKYSTTSEENKLFVKGLPVMKTKEDVEKLFEAYAPVDVRLIFQRNGESKGIAYVEFKTKEDAQKALELNSTKVDDNVLFVAISAPPPKKVHDRPDVSEPIRHARSRLQLPMIPRSLQVKSKPEKEKSDGNEASNKETKSNADFRNLFLKTK